MGRASRLLAVVVVISLSIMTWNGKVPAAIATSLPPPDATSAADSLSILLDTFFETVGLPPDDPKLAESVPKTDDDLTTEQKKDRMLACFDLTQQHMTANQHDYSQATRMAATSKGVREDDAMRLFLHGTVVACYNNIDESDMENHKSMSLTDSDILRILWRDDTTPNQLSLPQYEILGEVLAKFQEEHDGGSASAQAKGMGWLTLSGTMGMIYVVVILSLIGTVLFMAATRLSSVEKMKKEKKSTKKEKGRGAGAERKKQK